jgi:hypothetical protein
LPQEVVDDFIDDRFRSVGRVPIDHRPGFLAPAAGERGCACFRSCTRWRRPVKRGGRSGRSGASVW